MYSPFLVSGFLAVLARTYPYDKVGQKEKKLNEDITPAKTASFAVRTHFSLFLSFSLDSYAAAEVAISIKGPLDDVICKHLTKGAEKRGVYM